MILTEKNSRERMSVLLCWNKSLIKADVEKFSTQYNIIKKSFFVNDEVTFLGMSEIASLSFN